MFEGRPSLPVLEATQDMPRFLKTELSSLGQRLDQIYYSQADLKRMMMHMDHLVEGQAAIQSSLGSLYEAVGDLQRSANGSSGLSPQKSCGDVGLAPRGGGQRANLVDPAAPWQVEEKLCESPDKQPNGIASSAFSKRVAKQNRKKLQRIFEVDEEAERLEDEEARTPLLQRFSNSTEMQLHFVDAVALIAILANIAVVGARMDTEDAGYARLDVVFCLVFVFELLFRLKAHGIYGHFCGEDKIPRIFDASLIVVDTVQVALELFLGNDDTISASLFRLLRLGRFVKVLRVLRTKIFKDLLGMMQAIAGGGITLLWAGLFLLLLVYGCAIFCREALGTSEDANIQEYFATVPRSMFTIFRCSFGDCSSSAGTPIFEHVADKYGGGYGIMYCLFVFCVSIGLFNIISAIFVDGAMAAAASANLRRKQQALSNERLMALNVSRLIREVIALVCANGDTTLNKQLSSEVDSLLDLEVDRSVIDEIIKEPVAVEALHNLDIDPHDHDKLSDILDPDHGGTITVIDFVNGLQRLRGEPRRSDIVSVNLMIHALQDKVEEVFDRLEIVLDRVTHPPS